MDMQAAIRAVTERQNLAPQQMSAVMRTIMTGGATSAQIGGFLVGLRMKGETVEEVAAAAQVMRDLAAHVDVAELPNLIDVVGTGGDATGTFNISTCVSFVVAAAGAHVAKHGNRSVSTSSGAADLLEAAGVKIGIKPEQVAQCVRRVGVGFMFAPAHHSAMRHAVGPRREMAVRTLFNVLGPLTNPAGTPNQLVGVFADAWVEPLAQVFARLGSRHVMVVHSEDGMDELSIGAPTHVVELKDGEIASYTLTPEQFGLARAELSEVTVSSPAESLATVRAVLGGAAGPTRDIVLLNAGAAIYVAGLAASVAAGIEQARTAIDGGGATAKLDALAELTATF